MLKVNVAVLLDSVKTTEIASGRMEVPCANVKRVTMGTSVNSVSPYNKTQACTRVNHYLRFSQTALQVINQYCFFRGFSCNLF